MMAVSDQLIGAAIAQSRELLLLLDPEGLCFVYSNSAAESALGYASGEICELSPHDLFPEFSGPELEAILENLASSDHRGSVMNTVLVSKLSGMRDYTLQMQAVVIDGKSMVLISGQDITERMAEADRVHEMLAEAQQNSLIDPSSGLLQRIYFLPYLRSAISGASQSGKAFGLMLLDLENLTQIAEQFGQSSSDRVLLHVGQIAKRVVEAPEFSARFSDRVFCLLLPHATKKSAQELVSHLMRAIARLSYPEYPELKVRARMGIYFGNPEIDPEELLEKIGRDYRERRQKGRGDEVLLLLNPFQGCEE